MRKPGPDADPDGAAGLPKGAMKAVDSMVRMSYPGPTAEREGPVAGGQTTETAGRDAMRIVFVCTGNICRSPMAEGLLHHKWPTTDRDDLVASSMGTHGLDQSPAQPFAQQVCEARGVDISAHRSRPLAGEELREADLVLCMEPAHQAFIQTFFPWHKDRVHLLAAWPRRPTRKSVIPDPMGAPIGVYRKVFELIERHVDRILPELTARY